MCGRYAITMSPEIYRAFFGYEEQPNFPARYNVAPTQPVPIVHEDRDGRHFRLVRWGFLPGWVKDPKTFPLLINARGESVDTKAAFKAALKRRRCIFLADGFYEWRRTGRDKTPFLIRRADRAPLLVAGLWETYSDPAGGEIDTAAIITTDANGVLAAIHDRMPVILAEGDMAAWLDPANETDVMRFIKPCPEEWLDMVEISPRVNKTDNDDADLQIPVQRPEAPAESAPKKSDDRQGSLF